MQITTHNNRLDFDVLRAPRGATGAAGRDGTDGTDGRDGEDGTTFLVTTSPRGYPTLVAQTVAPPAVPGAVGALNVESGDAKLTVSWTTPTSDGGAAIEGYRVQYKQTGATEWRTLATTGLSTLVVLDKLANGQGYDVRVAALNFSGAGPYATVTGTIPGRVNGVVATDTFARTAADVVGTSPTTGRNAWSGTAGQYEVDGARLVGRAGANGNLAILDVGARGDKILETVVRLSTQSASAATGGRLYLDYIDNNNRLWLGVGVNAAGTTVTTNPSIVAGGVSMNFSAFPQNTIPAGAAAADYAVRLQRIGDQLSMTINGVTRTVTLTAAQLDAIKSATKSAFTADASNPTNLRWDTLSVSVNGYLAA